MTMDFCLVDIAHNLMKLWMKRTAKKKDLVLWSLVT